MTMRRVHWSALAACMGMAALPSIARSQRPSDFRSLSTPSPRIGTCGAAPAPLRLREDAPIARLEGRQLDISIAASAAHRIMMVYADPRGRPRQYVETSTPPAPDTPRESDEVEATIDSTGTVRGVLLHHTTRVHGTVRHVLRDLTGAERRRVRALAEWLLERCRS